MNIAWNAKDYAKDFHFVPRYGEDLLELVRFGDPSRPPRILDLGCGSGALSGKLKERGARVIGVDASPAMLEIARKDHPDIPFLQMDAARILLDEPVDTVFSNAVFHWIDDQDSLLSGIHRALKPGGELVCEFGGYGCCETIHAALRSAFARRGLEYDSGFYFPTVGEYAPRLESHGLRVVFAVLFDRLTPLNGPDGMENWIRMFDRHPFEGIDPQTAEEIIREAAEALRPALYRGGAWYADYVRIRFRAVKL